jgi:putative ABC transport system permease protein
VIRLWLRLISFIVPLEHRQRWREEWLAELQHGGRRMITGALPDAWAVRRLARRDLPAKAGSHTTSQKNLWLPPLGGRNRRSPLHLVGQDFRYALRSLISRPGFTISVVVSLAVGIATTSAAFGFLYDVTFRRVAGVAGQDRLVRMTVERTCGWPRCSVTSSTPEDLDVLRGSFQSFEGLAVSGSELVALRNDAGAFSVRGAVVSTNYFDVLGVKPVLGRSFSADEAHAGSADVAIISHTLWQRAFSADPNVVGAFIRVNERNVQLVGVTPRAFGATSKGNMAFGGEFGVEIWVPLPLADDVLAAASLPGGRPLPTTEYELTYVGRLRDGAELENAQAEADVAAPRLEGLRGNTTDYWVEMASFSGRTEAARLLRNLMVVPMLVLMIACLNAANLLLARANERARDVAVRLALGASRWRIVRQLLCESLLLALAAGAASVPAIVWLLGLAGMATGATVGVSRPAVIFTVVVTLLCSLGFGLAPALNSVRVVVPLGTTRPGDHGPGRMRVRRFMVGLQVALSLGLLATGGQVIAATRQLLWHTGASDPETLVLASFDLNPLKLERQAGEQFYGQLMARTSLLPGVESAALARRSAMWTWGRGSGNSSLNAWAPNEGPKNGGTYLGGYVAGDLTRTVGLRLMEGRGFIPSDATPVASTAIVSKAFADSKFKGSALGQTIRVAARSLSYTESVEVRIVGVIEAAEDRSYTDRPLPTVYVASPLQYEPALTLYVRAPGGIGAVGPALRALVRDIDARVPVGEMTTLARLTERRHFEERVMANGLTLLGAIALGLAAAGLYALVSFIVTLRQRELGIRMALGADRSGILRLVLSQSMRLAFAGASFGAIVAVVLGGIVHANLVGTVRLDVTLLVAAALVLSAVMLLASAVPARRAARLDPIVVLRQE